MVNGEKAPEGGVCGGDKINDDEDDIDEAGDGVVDVAEELR